MSIDHEQRVRVLRGALKHAAKTLEELRIPELPRGVRARMLALRQIIEGVLKEDDNQRKDS